MPSCFALSATPSAQRKPKSCERVGEVKTISDMSMQSRSLFSTILLAATLMVSCNKEDITNIPNEVASGQSKGKAAVNRIAYATPSAEGVTYTFQVSAACNCPHGTLQSSSTAPNENNILEQSSTQLYCRGTSAGSAYCVLGRGPNASTPGPQYYIKPANGGKVLAVRVKGGGVIPTSHDWFTYNTVANTWTPDADAGAYFVWSVLTGQPTNCCPGS